MYKFLVKNGQTIAFLLGVVIVAIFVVSIFSGLSAFDEYSDSKYETGIFDFGLYGAIFLIIVTAFAMVGFGVFQILSNLKGSVKGLIGFGVLVVLYLVAYNTSNGDLNNLEPSIKGAIEKFESSGNGIITSGNLKFIGGSITTVGVLVAVAALAFIVAEIRNLFK
jgi:hypothetical protein